MNALETADTIRPCAPPPCACGVAWTYAEFLAQPLPVSGREWQDAGAGEWLRLRNCRICGSTRAVEDSRTQ